MKIEVTYKTNFSMGSDLATQVAEMSLALLDQGELDITGLTIFSDPGAFWDGTNIVRVVTFLQTPASDERMGVPLTAEKRKSTVASMFNYKIGLYIRKTVEETIVLLP